MTKDQTKGTQRPCVIGVCGHRDLRAEDEPKLYALTLALFTRVQADQGPLALLTTLSEGACQLAARAALALSMPVYALLPMPQDAYIETFLRPDLAGSLKALLSQCQEIFIMPPPETGRDSIRAVRENSRILATHCHVMLAIWDGMDSSDDVYAQVGATVHDARAEHAQGVCASLPIAPVDRPDRMLWQLVVPRACGDVPQDAFAIRRIEG